jgi:hypothetical protein
MQVLFRQQMPDRQNDCYLENRASGTTGLTGVSKGAATFREE